jgi:hypothetical protein
MGNRVCGPENADLTYCPKDGVWSDTWHWCGDESDPGPNAYAGAYVDSYGQ